MVRYYKTHSQINFKKIIQAARENNRKICLLKLETTGLDPEKDEICGLHLIKMELKGNEAQIVEQYSSLIKTTIPISADASKISGITNEMLKTAPEAKNVLSEMNRYLSNSYICGFNTTGFIYPFLFKAAKNNSIKLNALGGFDIKDLAKTIILPDENGAGYSAKSLCALFHTTCDIHGQATVFEILYKGYPYIRNEITIDDSFVSKIKVTEKQDYIIFTTKRGLILLNCTTLYFEDYETVFDAVDMDAFSQHILKKTKSKTLMEAVQKIKTK